MSIAVIPTTAARPVDPDKLMEFVGRAIGEVLMADVLLVRGELDVMGAMASKKASAFSPVRDNTASARAGEVRGPVATTAGPSGSAVASSRTSVTRVVHAPPAAGAGRTSRIA